MGQISTSADLDKIQDRFEFLSQKGGLYGDIKNLSAELPKLFNNLGAPLQTGLNNVLGQLNLAKTTSDLDAVRMAIAAIQKQMSEIPTSSAISNFAKDLANLMKTSPDAGFTAELQRIQGEIASVTSSVGLDNLKAAVENAKSTYIAGYDEAKSAFDQLQFMSNSLANSIANKDMSTSGIAEMDALKQRIDTIRAAGANFNLLDPANITELRNINSEFDALQKKLNGLKTGNTTKLYKNLEQLSQVLLKNSGMSQDLRNRFEDLGKRMREAIDQGANRSKVQDLTQEFMRLKTEMYNTGQTGRSAFDVIEASLKSMNRRLVAQYLSIYSLIRYVRQGAKTVMELDSALTELRKVSGASDSRLAMSFQASADTAKELGSTIKDVIEATSDWARMGYAIGDAEELAKVATLFKNVGDNMSSEDANSYLISTLQAYHKTADEAESIVDVYNEVNKSCLAA